MAENSDNIASIEAARAAANDRADQLHGASEDLIAAEGRRFEDQALSFIEGNMPIDPPEPEPGVSSEIETTARLLCIASGIDPDEPTGGDKDPLAKRWEDFADDARMMLPTAEELAVGISITKTGADGGSEKIRPDEYYFPGERDEPTGIAPESLEQMHEADVETALIQRALAAEMKLEGLSMSLHEAYADNERTRAEMDGEMNRIAADAALVHNQLAFLSSALTRQFERVAGLRLYGGDLRAEQVVPFVQAEVDAVNATLTAIENRQPRG